MKTDYLKQARKKREKFLKKEEKWWNKLAKANANGKLDYTQKLEGDGVYELGDEFEEICELLAPYEDAFQELNNLVLVKGE